jgi:hypothetical protein
VRGKARKKKGSGFEGGADELVGGGIRVSGMGLADGLVGSIHFIPQGDEGLNSV